jgi:hypothetical protein
MYLIAGAMLFELSISDKSDKSVSLFLFNSRYLHIFSDSTFDFFHHRIEIIDTKAHT